MHPRILKKSRFTAHFIKANGLTENDFKAWVFYPGMLFKAQDTWWGNQNIRKR